MILFPIIKENWIGQENLSNYSLRVNMSSTKLPIQGNMTEEQHRDGFAPYISTIVFSIISLIFNFLVIFILSCFPNLRRRNSNKFLLNLMISNFCIGLVMLCFGAVVIALNTKKHTFDNHRKPPPSITLMFGVFILISVMNMTLLSGDRLYAVKWTFRYLESVTSTQIYIAIVSPWVISVIYFITLITLLHICNEGIQDIIQHIIYISFDVIAMLGFLTLAVSSAILYKEARIQLLRISMTNITVANNSRKKRKGFKKS